MSDVFKWIAFLQEIDRLESQGRFTDAYNLIQSVNPEMSLDGYLTSLEAKNARSEADRSDALQRMRLRRGSDSVHSLLNRITSLPDGSSQLAAIDQELRDNSATRNANNDLRTVACVTHGLWLARAMGLWPKAAEYCEILAGLVPFDLILGVEAAEIYLKLGNTERMGYYIRRCRANIESWEEPPPAAEPWITKLRGLEQTFGDRGVV